MEQANTEKAASLVNTSINILSYQSHTFAHSIGTLALVLDRFPVRRLFDLSHPVYDNPSTLTQCQ